MDKKEIVAEITKRIYNYNSDILQAGEAKLWKTAYELTIARDTLINLLAVIGEL